MYYECQDCLSINDREECPICYVKKFYLDKSTGISYMNPLRHDMLPDVLQYRLNAFIKKGYKEVKVFIVYVKSIPHINFKGVIIAGTNRYMDLVRVETRKLFPDENFCGSEESQ